MEAIMRNRFELIGRIASVNNGENYVSFSVAEDQGYKGKDDQWIERTEFHPVVAFEGTAKRFDSYLAKGDLVKVEGVISWKDMELEGKKYRMASLVAKDFTRLSRPDSKDQKES
jgi:single-strand DNA-binding protein